MSIRRFAPALGFVTCLHLWSCHSIVAPAVRPFATGEDWVLLEPLRYQLGNTKYIITVPAGFITDHASVPRCFCAILPVHGRYDSAAIVHDFLYWDQTCTREQSDAILRAAMIESRVNPLSVEAIFQVVHIGGQKAWDQNAADRLTGLIRVLPLEFRQLPSGVTWPDYRRSLQVRLAQEPAYDHPTASACTVGASLFSQ